ncbi:MAG: LysM peptidoglycan-binding domain-containing protein, partial [Chloroflexi bacterium]
MSNNLFGLYVAETELTSLSGSQILWGRHVKTAESVLIEFPFSESAPAKDLVSRCLKRADLLGQLSHPALPRVQETAVTPEGLPYTILTPAPKRTLADQIAQWQNQPPAPVSALHLVRQIAEALKTAESANLIHHHLHPALILLTEENQPLITGFTLPPPPLPLTLPADHQLDYIPPEYKQNQTLTFQSNIYTLGIILYELLAGHRPKLPISEWDIFETNTLPREIPLDQACPGLQPATYQAVKNCLWRHTWARYESYDSLLAALDEAIAAEESPPPPRRTLGLAIPWPLTGIAGGVIILLLAGMLWFNGRPSSPLPPPTPVLVTETAVFTPTPSPSPSPLATSLPAQVIQTTTSATATPTLLPTSTSTPTATHTKTPSSTPSATATSILTNTPIPTETAVCTPAPPPGWQPYTIQAGDTLFNLALQTGTTVSQISSVNCLVNNILTVGQTIWLPPLPTLPP